MLRDYQYSTDRQLVDIALVEFIDQPQDFSVGAFTVITPDSFLWQLRNGKERYYLYAEDFPDSLEHIKQTIEVTVALDQEAGTRLEFVEPKQTIDFEASSPKQSAYIYKPPEDEEVFMRYASQSGYDFVFLLVEVD